MFSLDFFRLIAEQIDDSTTWCRMSQTNKKINELMKSMLKPIKRTTSSSNGNFIEEIAYTKLPDGTRHGMFQYVLLYSIYNSSINSKTGYYKDGIDIT